TNPTITAAFLSLFLLSFSLTSYIVCATCRCRASRRTGPGRVDNGKTVSGALCFRSTSGQRAGTSAFQTVISAEIDQSLLQKEGKRKRRRLGRTCRSGRPGAPFPASSFSQTFGATLYIPVLPLSRNRTADFSFLSIARDATCAFCRASPCMARHDGTYRRWQAGFFKSPALCPFGSIKALSGAFAELLRPFPSREVGLSACLLDAGCLTRG
ncbi:hypothetical protein CH063_11406, partial [Colletotrichum higginsianum]